MVLVDTSVWIEYFKGFIDMQTQNITNGINKVGIPDLIIAQNAINNNLLLFSFDKHFSLMRDLFGLNLFTGE